MFTTPRTSLPLVLTLFAPLGCAKATADTPVSKPEASAVVVDEDDENPEEGVARIDAKIVELCELDEAHFGFDSTALDPSTTSLLDALAECFTGGPAAELDMRLVGHADPRGDDEYNLGLGQRRAGSVAGYLTERGLAAERVETSSRGAMDAKGVDEATWAKDRNVEILLAE